MINRRNVLLFLIILCVLLCGLFLFGEEEYTELAFSNGSGFYDEPFKLRLYAPRGTEIYYTLDGTEPDENAIRYTEPIYIDDATKNENVYSMRTDVSAGFLTEEIALYSTEAGPPGYVIPDYPVDKCTIIRAAYRDAEGNFSKSKTESYFVGYGEKVGYDGLNIISIVTEPDNLFGYDKGIYVLGDIFDEFVANAEDRNNRTWAAWGRWKANYKMTGREWERPASVQLFNSEKELELNQECGIRIQGGSSRSPIPKSLNLYARDEYDNNGRFYIDLFETGYMADTINLNVGGGDSIAKIRDRIMAELVEDREFATMHFVPYAMFLDGEYWGVYWLTEKYDDVFLQHYYDVDRKDVVMVKRGGLAEGKEEDLTLYTEMMEYMANTDFSIEGNYEYACQLIDMQSFIDYYASEIYIGRCGDWPSGNIALWRTRDIGEGKYEDGKWRWMLFDVNGYALSEDLISADTFLSTMEESRMFYNLCQNDGFKRQFVTSFMDIVNTCFVKENIDTIIDEHCRLMMEPIRVYTKRFFGNEDLGAFTYRVGETEDFFDKRRSYITQYLKADFGLNGKLVPVRIGTNDVDAGIIRINTAELVLENGVSWYGEYYTDYPITLTAIPNSGYCFAGWDNGAGEIIAEEESIELDIGDGLHIKAVFEKTSW